MKLGVLILGKIMNVNVNGVEKSSFPKINIRTVARLNVLRHIMDKKWHIEKKEPLEHPDQTQEGLVLKPRFPLYQHPHAGYDTTIYHKIPQKCACKGTGLVPPNNERIGKEPQAYCPLHICKRFWPQQQKNGSVEFKELGRSGLL